MPILPTRGIGQAVAAEAPPGEAAVRGFVDATSRTATGAVPGAQRELPHAGEKNARVVGIHGDVGAAGVLVHEEHSLPGLAAISGAEDAALGLWAESVAECAGENDIRSA